MEENSDVTITLTEYDFANNKQKVIDSWLFACDEGWCISGKLSVSDFRLQLNEASLVGINEGQAILTDYLYPEQASFLVKITYDEDSDSYKTGGEFYVPNDLSDYNFITKSGYPDLGIVDTNNPFKISYQNEFFIYNPPAEPVAEFIEWDDYHHSSRGAGYGPSNSLNSVYKDLAIIAKCVPGFSETRENRKCEVIALSKPN